MDQWSVGCVSCEIGAMSCGLVCVFYWCCVSRMLCVCVRCAVQCAWRMFRYPIATAFIPSAFGRASSMNYSLTTHKQRPNTRTRHTCGTNNIYSVPGLEGAHTSGSWAVTRTRRLGDIIMKAVESRDDASRNRRTLRSQMSTDRTTRRQMSNARGTCSDRAT